MDCAEPGSALDLPYYQLGAQRRGFPPLRWYDVLWELDRAKDGLRPFELEKKLIFEQSNLSRLLRRIIDEGLIEEFAYPNDGRGKVLKITKSGHSVRKKMWKIYGPLIDEHVGEIAKNSDPASFAATLMSLVNGG